MGKDPIKKSTTLVANIGTGSAGITSHVFIDTDVGGRNLAGAAQTIRDNQTTSNICNVGNIIKYVNLCIQVASRNVTGDVPTPDDNGWLEYAIVKHKEVRQTMSIAGIGTETLMTLAARAFRGDCLWTGCLPLGASQPNSMDMRIKVPKIFTKLQIGSSMEILVWFRSTNTTDLRTDSTRVLLSSQYKCYV